VHGTILHFNVFGLCANITFTILLTYSSTRVNKLGTEDKYGEETNKLHTNRLPVIAKKSCQNLVNFYDLD